jgi:heavy metal sensor kinase
MKIFKSIKWRLQLWYGLILVAVLAGFGLAAYQLERGQLLGRIDDELRRRVGILVDVLHRPPPHAEGEAPFDRPPPEQDRRPPSEFHLPQQRADLFDASSPNNFYFIIDSSDGKEIARSSNVPVVNSSDLWVEARSFVADGRGSNIRRPGLQPLRKYQEVIQTLPRGERVVVGCSIEPELKELHRTALELIGVGGIILLFGLAGGWWFVSRAIRPIENISATAVKISAGDLSQRINVAETESELGNLAAVLNSTFARLESAFAQQKQFASDAAHELRTPVTVILTQTQTALNRERAAEDYKQTVEACQRAAQRMKKLISSLLELARLDAGQEQMKRLSFDFSKTVADCVELICPLANERHVEIFSELAPIEMAGDSERLAQVVTNLLTNAIQYNHEGGEVRVKLESQNDFAVLTVSDTGAGILPEDLPRVFDRFYRADKSRTGANTGLGLAISKAIVDAHGGMIEAVSGENGGAKFTVRLPKA